MAQPWTNATFTTEFGHEFEAERQSWLRRRFLWYVSVALAFSFIGLASAASQSASLGPWTFTFQVAVQVIGIIAHGAALLYVWRNRAPRIPILRIVYLLIVGMGTLVLLTGPMIVGGMSDSVREAVREGRSAAPAGPGAIPAPEQPEARGPGETQESGQATPLKPSEEVVNGQRKGRERRAEAVATILAGVMGVWTIFISHFFACVFLPWTARESLKPIIPLLCLNAIITGGFAVIEAVNGNWSWSIAAAGALLLLLSVLMPLPGMAVCWSRNSRFRQRFTLDAIRGRYSELRQELAYARQIHESLFPKPIKAGPVRFDYVYEPMRQIGGDYLHSHVSRSVESGPGGQARVTEAYNFVLVDVTGHGIPAALTVNRLYGEMARIFAENPEAGPGEVLKLLNSYVHLTLATHSVYVTAICFRINPETDAIEYASGGHPPAFLKSVDGKIEQLDSTSFVLGACAGADFNPEPRMLRFSKGDVLIAYTDGATEARDHAGRYLGIRGLQRIVAAAPVRSDKPWLPIILEAVESHRHGPTADDILVIEIRRPLATDSTVAPPPKTRTGIVNV